MHYWVCTVLDTLTHNIKLTRQMTGGAVCLRVEWDIEDATGPCKVVTWH